MLDSKIIIKEILPYLSEGKVGKERELELLEIVQAIFHRLKTGCQWRELPIKQFISRPNTSWNAIYYYFNKWCKDGSWRKVWINIVKTYKKYLDLSCINIDGSLTRAFRGGEAVGYNGRKKYRGTNLLFIVDNQGVILFITSPISGEHHDLYEIKEHFSELEEMAKDCEIDLEALFLNADGGFDDKSFREYLELIGIEPNISLNARNGNVSDREEYFDELLYKRRAICEHPFAWMDAYKGLLVRYEKLSITWLGMNLMGMVNIFTKKITKHIINNL